MTHEKSYRSTLEHMGNSKIVGNKEEFDFSPINNHLSISIIEFVGEAFNNLE